MLTHTIQRQDKRKILKIKAIKLEEGEEEEDVFVKPTKYSLMKKKKLMIMMLHKEKNCRKRRRGEI